MLSTLLVLLLLLLLCSHDPQKKLGALLAIDELIEKAAFKEDAVRISGFCGLLRRVFEEAEELRLIEVAAQALGKLVKQSGQNMADIVDKQVCLWGRGGVAGGGWG